MLEKRTNISIYITDHKIGFYESDVKKNKIPKYGFVDLDMGTVVSGDIKEPEIFYKKIQSLLKQHHIKPGVIRYVINDQTVLKKEINIPKEELQKMSIENYVLKQMGKTIHFPFQHPVFTHIVRSETETHLNVLLIISDGEILHDHHDIFDRLKAKQVILDLPSLSLYNAYITRKGKTFKNLMLVSLYDRSFTIKIIEDNLPIFSVTEEVDDSSQLYFDVLENYVERILNYYKFNLQKGSREIENIVFYNFSEDFTHKMVNEKVQQKFKEHTFDICEINDTEEFLKKVPKICLMGYAASLPKHESLEVYQSLNFNLNRVPSINQSLNYLLAMAFLIVSSMILIYIPYYLQNELIVNQMNMNSVLQNQLEDLQRQTPVSRTYTTVERNYSRAYDYLIEKETFASEQLIDLFSLLNDDVNLISYSVSQDTKTITIIISSLDEFELNDYLLYIYEYHGIITEATEERWMVTRPQTKFLSEEILEVTMNYA